MCEWGECYGSALRTVMCNLGTIEFTSLSSLKLFCVSTQIKM